MNADTTTLLVLDDNRDAADALGDLCESQGFTVHRTYSVREALDALDDNPGISVVISDVRMPDVDGFDFLRVVRLRHRSLKVILLTGHTISEDDVVPHNAIVLQKPLTIPTLLSTLASFEGPSASG